MEAVKETGSDAVVEKVGDLMEIVKLGVMAAPSLMIDGKLVIAGRTAKTSEIVRLAEEMMEAGKGLWSLIQDQILGMKWLKDAVGAGLTAMGTDISSRLGGSVHFFIYDIIKITILLCTLIFLISYIQSYFPPERSKRILGRFHGLGARIAAALLGTVTPFCSCSSIPLFMGFTGAGLPLGVTFSFLISSPMVDLGSLVLLTSIFGVKIAAVYVLLGLFVAVLGGTVIEKLHMEAEVEEFIRMAGRVDLEGPALTVRDRWPMPGTQVESTFKKVFPYILAGVGIGAVIHNWIPGNGSRLPWEAEIPLA